MAHALSKFKRQDNDFIKVGTELGFRMRNVKRVSSNLASASMFTENCDKERTKAFCMREMVGKHPEFLKAYCQFDPDSKIFRIRERRKALYSKFPSIKKCWKCGITRSKIDKLQTCTACRKSKYCSVECQVSNWNDHKDFCKKLLKLNNEIKSIEITKRVVEDMNFIFVKSPRDGALRALGFHNNFDDQGFDQETIEIITRTGYDLGKRIARIINDKIGPQITLKTVQDVFNQTIPEACNNIRGEVI